MKRIKTITYAARAALAGLAFLTCEAQVFAGTCAVDATTLTSKNLNTLMTYAGSIPQATIDSLDYTHCFGDGTTANQNMAFVIFQKLQAALPETIAVTPGASKFALLISGYLPVGTSGAVSNYLAQVALVSAQSASSAVLHQCEAAARQALAFPSKYAFYVFMSDNSAGGQIQANPGTLANFGSSSIQRPASGTQRNMTFMVDSNSISGLALVATCGVLRRE